jgi:hypothetical protein
LKEPVGTAVEDEDVPVDGVVLGLLLKPEEAGVEMEDTLVPEEPRVEEDPEEVEERASAMLNVLV